jgi:type IV pilus assembly protein PilV
MTIIAFDNLSRARRATARRLSPRVPNRSQRGFMLLEVLISILLFALGFIALMGMEGRAVSATTEDQNRAVAVQLANAYLGQIWAAQNSYADLNAMFEGSGLQKGDSPFDEFSQQIHDLFPTSTDDSPSVKFVDNSWSSHVTGTTTCVTQHSVNVSVQIKWEEPSRKDASNKTIEHNVLQVTNISFQPSSSAAPVTCPDSTATSGA